MVSELLTPGRQATRARILSGASEVLVELGVRDTAVRDILERASVARRTFYQYFRSIDQVLDTLYEQALTELFQQVSAALAASEDPRDKIVSFIEAYLDFQEAGGALLILLQAEAVRPESPLAARRDRALDALVQIIDQAVRASVGATIDPLVYRSLLIGGEGTVIHVQRKGDFSSADRERVRGIMCALVGNVLVSYASLPSAPAD